MYRTVDSATWDDPWFSELEPMDKLIFLHAITNRRQNASGAFEVTARAIAFETGIMQQEVELRLRKLAPKLEWWPEYQIMWVRNFYRRQHANSNKDNFAKGARAAIASFPPDVIEIIVHEYPELGEGIEGAGEGIPNPSPSHTHPIGIKKQLKETVKETVNETVDGGADAPATRGSKLPKDFTVTPDMKLWAIQKAPLVEVEHETEQFCLHHRSKGSVFKDWPAAWYKWMGKSQQYAEERQGRSNATNNSSRRKSAAEAGADLIGRILSGQA